MSFFLSSFIDSISFCKAYQQEQKSVNKTIFAKEIQHNEIVTEPKGVVVLDAGHGGTDGGSVGNGYLEKKCYIRSYK